MRRGQAKAEAEALTVLPIRSGPDPDLGPGGAAARRMPTRATPAAVRSPPTQCPVCTQALAQTGWKPTTYLIDQCATIGNERPHGANATNRPHASRIASDAGNPAYATRPDGIGLSRGQSEPSGSGYLLDYAAVGWVKCVRHCGRSQKAMQWHVYPAVNIAVTTVRSGHDTCRQLSTRRTLTAG